MTHELYKQTLLGGEVVRLLNTRIASSNHRLHTIVVNKKSLSGYDDKRFILSDQVSMLPYGHNSLREDMFYKTILDDPDWGLLDTSQNEQESTHLAQDSSHLARDSTQQVQDSPQQAQDSSQQAQDSSQQAQDSPQQSRDSTQQVQDSPQQAQDSSQQAQDSSHQAQDSSHQAQDSTQQAQDSSQQAQDSSHQLQDSTQQIKSKNQQKRKRQTQQSANVPQTISILNTSFSSIPDPGFHQRNYSEDELNENLVDFDNLSEFSDSGSSTDAACEGFILSQAIEDSDSNSQPPITIERQPSTNLPITNDQEFEQAGPPKKKRRARTIESYSEED